MERRYKETESSAVREELAKFISNRHVPAAKGRVRRLGKRATFMSRYAAACISDMSMVMRWNSSTISN
ncbi:hypothetical protein ACLK1S_25340 [Escherichia coli]